MLGLEENTARTGERVAVQPAETYDAVVSADIAETGDQVLSSADLIDDDTSVDGDLRQA